MRQKTQGVVTSKIVLSKTRGQTAEEVVRDFAKRSGINLVSATIYSDGAEIVATYGPVWGGQEYDVRQKMAAAMRKVGCAGQVTYDSKRLAVASR